MNDERAGTFKWKYRRLPQQNLKSSHALIILMEASKHYDTAIIGGSYAGLSAALALGRALRQVAIFDSSEPCNKQTPHSHNFITQDGETPAAIAKKAKEQVLKYTTVNFISDKVTKVVVIANGFELETECGTHFRAKKLLFASGITDLLPDMEGLKECWGISVIHCPYCHGYEVKQKPTGILMNGDMAFDMAKLINNWTNDLTVFTNGSSTLTSEQTQKLASKHIRIVETKLKKLNHTNGYLSELVFSDGSTHSLTALYTRPAFKQHCGIPQQLGCELTESGHLKVDQFQKTTLPDIFAAGDCTTAFRSVAKAVSEGAMAGATLNKELIEENF
jgi:thioredoxin reductase